jgi:hypothetical protein
VGGATFAVALRPRQRRPEGLADLELAWTLTGLRDDIAAEGRSRLSRPSVEATPANPPTPPKRSALFTGLAVSALVGVGILALLFVRLRRTP